MPSWWQAILAAFLGVSIGLSLSWLLDRNHSERIAHLTDNIHVTQSLNMLTKGKATNLFNVNQVDVLPSLSKRTNILLMGVDSNGRNTKRFENTRADTIILASLDPISGMVGLISIPRDSRVKIADRSGADKINAAHALGGPELVVKTVEQVFNIPIDHYVVIDTVGIKEVCEFVGPIEVMVEKRMRYRDRASRLNIDLEPGLQELSAEQVEQYLRFRHDQQGDIGRIQRQQWFLRQAQAKLRDPSMVLKLPNLMKFANDYMVTDMSIQDMAAIFKFAKNISEKSVKTATLPGEAATIHGGSYWLPDPEATALVLQRLTGTAPSISTIAANTVYAGRDPEELLSEQDGLDNYDHDYNKNSLQTAWDSSYTNKPYSVIIRYPRGQEQTARDFQQSLSYAGYKVRSLICCKEGDCQHEQIVLNSFRADDSITSRLKQNFPSLDPWAIVLNPTSKSRTDMTLQLTPNTAPLLPEVREQAALDYQISDFVTGEVKSKRPLQRITPRS